LVVLFACIGSAENVIAPSGGWLSSSIKKIDVETVSAPITSAAIAVALRGANRPKPTNIAVSQEG